MSLDSDITRSLVDSLRNELGSAQERIRALERALAELEQRDGQRKDTLHALGESEAFLEQSAEIAHLGYAIWDDALDRDITVTEELARIHGSTRAEYLEAVGSMDDYMKFVVPEDREKYLRYELLITADDSGEAAGIEYRIRRPSGEIRHLHQRSQYIPRSSGSPNQSIVVIQDVTEQKQAESRLKESREALEEREAMLTQSVAMANLGHAVRDHKDGNYVHVSEEWAKIFGYTKEEFLTKFSKADADQSLIHPGDLERYRAYYENQDPNNLVPNIEYRIVTRKKVTRHLLQSHKYVFGESGERVQSLLTIHDITDRIEHENRLDEARNAAEQASVAKSSFLANMSHEIRTPLNGVIGCLGLLGETRLDKRQGEFVSTAHNSAETLLTLIDNLLDLSKIEAGKLELERTDFDPGEIVEETRELFEPTAHSRGLRFSVEDELPTGLVKGDAGRIRQILFNFISNALKFTLDGEIVVRGKSPATGRLRFEVSDTGIGIEPAKQEELFDRFYQAESALNRRFGGVGLGLAICRELAELMLGEIGLDSQPGRGSTFWIDVPVEAAANVEIANEVAPGPQKRLHGRILLVEDSATNAFVAKSRLEKSGLHVEHVVNGLEALEAVRRRTYDLVLMDVSMPVMDGLEATRKIRALDTEGAKVPIVAMTSHALSGDRSLCLKAGMDGYVAKPVKSAILFAEIERLLPPSGELSSAEQDDSIDAESVFRVWGDDHEGYRDAAEIFCVEARDRFERIRQARQEEAFDAIEIHAHSLKSAAGNVACEALSKSAGELERVCRNRAGPEEIDRAIAALKNAIEPTLERLSR